jgi:hypothetical protein
MGFILKSLQSVKKFSLDFLIIVGNSFFLNVKRLKVGKTCCPFMEGMVVVAISMERAMVLVEEWLLHVTPPINEEVHACVIKW